MSKVAFMYIHALTGLHPGSGSALGTVDLPVQRERHTDWPIIPGSSLKGVMRAASHRRADSDNEAALAAFGPESHDAHEHAGAVSFSDARILGFPVRSLVGVFAWVTCPAVLSRLQRDLEIGNGGLPEFASPERDSVFCAADSPLIADKDRLLLEEYEFRRIGDANSVSKWLASHAVGDRGTAERLHSHLAILHDDDFTHFVRHATEIVARVGLDYAQKTVRKGALFYEEYLPPESIFYSLVATTDSRRKSRSANAAEVMAWLTDQAPSVLQIGGGETVGKGLCAIRFVNHDAETE